MSMTCLACACSVQSATFRNPDGDAAVDGANGDGSVDDAPLDDAAIVDAADPFSFFVTSGAAGTGGNLGGLLGADAFCEARADIGTRGLGHERGTPISALTTSMRKTASGPGLGLIAPA